MYIPRKQSTRIFLTFLLFASSFIVLSPSGVSISKAIEVTPDTVVEMKDIVIVNYTLWVQKVRTDDQEGKLYVVDPDTLVPNSIIEEHPDIRVPPNVGFREALLGMKAGETKSVEVDASKGFTNITDELYGEDLFYEIRLLEILVDASTPGVTLEDLPFFIPFVVLIGFVIILLIILRIQRFTSTHDFLGLKVKCFTCGGIADVKCGNLGCATPYCKKCFLQENKCVVCQSNIMVPLKYKGIT